MSDFAPEALDAMLSCFFLGGKAPSSLTIGAFRKSGKEVVTKGYTRMPFEGAFEIKDGILFNSKDIVFAPARDDWGEVISVAVCDGDKRIVSFNFKDGLSVTVGTKLRIPAKQMSIRILAGR